ncbi:prepilin peptidase [Chitinimonas arctica]|uniref:prepilin peptidase n=1 Tax=Chitinimonas arctica TaxID=2594795 RepID=UPI0015D2AEDE|nr:A24 family peptidase [Chitinimonas arctica]
MIENIPSLAFAAASALLGAFFIPVLARLIPLRLEQSWRREVIESGKELAQPLDPGRFNITFIERIAIIASSLTISAIALDFGNLSTTTLVATFYFFAMLLLLAINLKHLLLPDVIVQSTLWVGLLYHALVGDPSNFVLGACVAYLAPYSLSLFVKFRTGKEFVGHGDLKCFAMAGAWFGVHSLPMLFLVFFTVSVALAIAEAFTVRASRLLPTGIAHVVSSVAVLAGGYIV